MKKTVCSFSILLCLVGTILGQQKWVPDSLSLTIPMRISQTYVSTIPGSESNSIDTMNRNLTMGLNGFLKSYSKSGDTISIEYEIDYFRHSSISFIIDTINKKLRNFYCSSNQDIYYSTVVLWARYFSLSYKTSPNGSIMINNSSASCRASFDSAFYSLDNTEHSGQYYRRTQEQSIALVEDTSSFRISVSFPSPQAEVSTPKSMNLPQMIYRQGRLVLSFDNNNNPQKIAIFDLLGRKRYDTELRADASELMIDRLEKGQYFLKIGGQYTKFIIP
jgi:hypothetical protein